MSEEQNPGDAILEAAMARILHYGYAKTTMAEIARDCSMSAGNIYRFFNSKLDIAEALAEQENRKIFAEYDVIAGDARLSPPERLVKTRLALLERSFELLEKDDKIMELAIILDEERPLFMNRMFALEREHIVQILRDGEESGHFRAIDDAEFLAEMIQSATTKFRFPQLFCHLDLPSLRRELDGVMALLLAGLRAGPQQR